MAVKWESNFSFMWGKKTPSAITQSDISDDLFYGVQSVPIPHPRPTDKDHFFSQIGFDGETGGRDAAEAEGSPAPTRTLPLRRRQPTV